MMYATHNISQMSIQSTSSGYIVERQRPLSGGLVDCFFSNTKHIV